jgi:hypothetical protein
MAWRAAACARPIANPALIEIPRLADAAGICVVSCLLISTAGPRVLITIPGRPDPATF